MRERTKKRNKSRVRVALLAFAGFVMQNYNPHKQKHPLLFSLSLSFFLLNVYLPKLNKNDSLVSFLFAIM